MRRLLPLLLLMALGASPDDRDPKSIPDAELWSLASKTLSATGELKDGVYTITLPRKDLAVTTEMGDVPPTITASRFQFFRCPCGKVNVIGQFCLADYEANDVIDALREGNHIRIASVSPMLLGEKPKLLLVHFQGEGHGDTVPKLLKSALQWVGEARSPKRPLNP